MIFSQPRSPAPNGKPSHPRGGLAGKLQHCPVANISCSKFLQCVLRAFYYVHLIFSHCMLNSEKTANFWLLFWKSYIMWEVAVQRVYTMCTGEQPPFWGGFSHFISVTSGLSLDIVQNRKNLYLERILMFWHPWKANVYLPSSAWPNNLVV